MALVRSVLQVFYPSRALTLVSLLADLLCIACLCLAHRDNSWLGELDAVTRCLDAVPQIVLGNVTFNVLYNSMFSLFYSQACQMDTRLGGGMQLSGAFFNLGDAVAVIILTPLLERFIVPKAEKLLGREVSSNMKVLTGRILVDLRIEFFRVVVCGGARLPDSVDGSNTSRHLSHCKGGREFSE